MAVLVGLAGVLLLLGLSFLVIVWWGCIQIVKEGERLD